VFSLPDPNDLNGQIAAGQNLISQVQNAAATGDVSGLLDAGIALALPGTVGTVLTDSMGGALTGLAMAGPAGAAFGAVLGAVEGISSLFAPADSVIGTYGQSEATNTITQRVAKLAGMNTGIYSGNPVGWHMADFCAFAFPPSSSQNADLFDVVFSAAKTSLIANLTGFGNAGYLSQLPGYFTNPLPASEILSVQQALCTPVWFLWYQSQQIVDCDQDLFFGSGGAGGTPNQLLQTWLQNANAVGGLSKNVIIQRAIARAPDPLFWSTDLYGSTFSSGVFSSGFATVYYNVDLINAMATVLMMLAAGASTQAIVSELLMQQAILANSGSKAPGQGTGSLVGGDVNHVGFQQLLAWYINLANAENEAAGLSLGTWGMVGAVALGALATLLVGTLGYSVYTRQSPRVVMQAEWSRTKAAVSRVGRGAGRLVA